jgi:hypothetical protein
MACGTSPARPLETIPMSPMENLSIQRSLTYHFDFINYDFQFMKLAPPSAGMPLDFGAVSSFEPELSERTLSSGSSGSTRSRTLADLQQAPSSGSGNSNGIRKRRRRRRRRRKRKGNHSFVPTHPNTISIRPKPDKFNEHVAKLKRDLQIYVHRAILIDSHSHDLEVKPNIWFSIFE